MCFKEMIMDKTQCSDTI